MITVKVECDCGQRYEYNVEPVNGRAPYIITCPTCGADGTAAANDFIARNQPPPENNESPASSSVKNPEQAQTDARAKISWGDPPEAVVKFLMLQGYGAREATDIVAALSRERAAAVRGNGLKKIIIGGALICIPVATIFYLRHGGALFSIKGTGAAIGVGLWGLWLVLQGLVMMIAPKLENSDLADQ